MIARPVRMIAAIIAALALAFLLLLQAGSSVLMLKNPALAARLMPINGLALEQAASREFMAGVTTEADIVPSARAALPTALRAFSHEPLSPKALAIMAIAERDPGSKRILLDAASQINRRDLLLQGLVLDNQIARKDYPGTLKTLDNILRAHPEQSASFFPILSEALKDDAAAVALGSVIDLTSGWHRGFLEFAASKPGALPNLAKLRLAREEVDPSVDRQLISGLVSGGDVDQAFRVYQKAIIAAGAEPTAGSKLSWSNAFPPFDWRLSNDAGFRAQSAVSTAALDIFVRSGKGGILAERLIAAPQGVATINIVHSITPAPQVKDVRLQLSCPGDENPAIDQPFRLRPAQVRVPALASRCKFIRVVIYARSWSGRSSIRGDINRLEIVAN